MPVYIVSLFGQDDTGGPYPVMVWIHGGGFNSGANIQYSPHFLASHGVVVVVPNYRLDVMGTWMPYLHATPWRVGLIHRDAQMSRAHAAAVPVRWSRLVERDGWRISCTWERSKWDQSFTLLPLDATSMCNRASFHYLPFASLHQHT